MLTNYMPAAKDIASAKWIDPNGRTRGFQAQSRCWGVVDDEGRMLSDDGVNPSTWGRKSTAAIIAEYLPRSPIWIEPVR